MESKLGTFLTKVSDAQASATPEPTDAGATPATGDKPAEPVVSTAPAASVPPAEKTSTEATAPESAEAKAERERDEQGRFKPKSDVELGLQAAIAKLRDENRKLKAAKGQPAVKPEKPISFYDDADAAARQLEARVEGKLMAARYNDSERAAAARHTDFATVVTPFLEECATDEALGIQIFNVCNQSDDPAEAFYKAAKRHAALKDFNGDLDAFAESRLSPLKTEVETLKAQLAERDKRLADLSSIPSSLANTQNAAPAGGEMPGGKRSLGSIVGERKNKRRNAA